jgi:hypothetical protein
MAVSMADVWVVMKAESMAESWVVMKAELMAVLLAASLAAPSGWSVVLWAVLMAVYSVAR